VDMRMGRFHCFACGAWGYMEWARDRWREGPRCGSKLEGRHKADMPARTQPPRADLAELLRAYQAALPGSPGADYIRSRGIP
jgi:hypothetical protein